jgi:hypothetical protein
VIVFALFALLVLSFPLQPTSAQAQRCFPQTNQCISGRFRQFWEQNGGLQVFGYPITAAANEVNRDTGQTYLTQWFERNRFELHPENRPPYDVLLGRLGDDRLRQLGRNWQAEPRENGPQANCLWFERTGHNVCNQGGALGFRTYWERNGLRDPALNAYGRSLALFGLPLTAPRMETNTSGDTVLTQWFERARFEWHPNNPNPFKVLLGLLGNEVRTGVGTPLPTTPPATTATASPTSTTPTATPTRTTTPTTGPTTTTTATTGPTATPTLPPPSLNNCQADPRAPAAPNYPVRIVGINKVTEVVTLRNVSAATVSLNGWTMCSIRGNQQHQGIGGTLGPGEQRDFPNTGAGNIWSNDEEDDGALYNQNGQLVSYWND